MHRLNELATKLTPAQVKEVEDFAEFLIARAKASTASPSAQSSRKISFEGWGGALAGVESEKSNKQIIQEAWDEIAAKYD